MQKPPTHVSQKYRGSPHCVTPFGFSFAAHAASKLPEPIVGVGTGPVVGVEIGPDDGVEVAVGVDVPVEAGIGVTTSPLGTVMIVPAIENAVPDCVVQLPVIVGNDPYANGNQPVVSEGAAVPDIRYTVAQSLVCAAIQYVPAVTVRGDPICNVFQPIDAMASPV